MCIRDSHAVAMIALGWSVGLALVAGVAALLLANRSEHFGGKAVPPEADPLGIGNAYDHETYTEVSYEYNRCLLLKTGYRKASNLLWFSAVAFAPMSSTGRFGTVLLIVGLFTVVAVGVYLLRLRRTVLQSQFQERLDKRPVYDKGTPITFGDI